MKQTKGKRSLEAYKIFPYVAWGLILGFTFFVYNLVTDLQDTTSQLQKQTNALQQQVSSDLRTTDFDSYNEDRYQSDKNRE
jgi:hypothetical protein